MSDIDVPNRFWPQQHLDDAVQGDALSFRLEGWTAYLDESFPWPLPRGRVMRTVYPDTRDKTIYQMHPRSGEEGGYLLLKGINKQKGWSAWERFALSDGALRLKGEAGISGEANREAYRIWDDGYVWLPEKIRGNMHSPAKHWVTEFAQTKYANCSARSPVEPPVTGVSACELWGPFGLHRDVGIQALLDLLRKCGLTAEWGRLAIDSLRGLPVSLGKPHVQPWVIARLEYWGDRPGKHTSARAARAARPESRSELFEHLEVYLSMRAGNDGLGRVGWIKCQRVGSTWVAQRILVSATVVWDRVKPFPHCELGNAV